MSKHQGSTDSTHTVLLPSAIQAAWWRVQECAVGEEAPLEAIFLFVGDGANVRIEVRTRSGKAVGKIEGKAVTSRFGAEFPLPEKTDEDIYFEVQLPKHGLKERSGLLRVLPRRSITNAKWDRQEARRGDFVKLSADTRNIPVGTKVRVAIYEHDANGAHDFVTEFRTAAEQGKIQAEWQFEYHDKTVEIPAHDDSQAGYKHSEYLFRVSAGKATAESGLLKFKDSMEIRLADDAGRPMTGEDYVLHLPDGTERRGKLDGQGSAAEKDLPPGPVRVEFPNRPDVGWEA